MTRLKAMLALLLSRDALHTYVAAGSLLGIWWGLAQTSRPLASVVVSSLFLAGIIYARTRE